MTKHAAREGTLFALALVSLATACGQQGKQHRVAHPGLPAFDGASL